MQDVPPSPLRMLSYLRSLKLSALLSEDLSFTEYAMLRLMDEVQKETRHTDIWVSDLVRRVHVTPQAVSKYIHLAQRKGYIECFENENDRRSMGIRMTERGKAVLRKSTEEMTAFHDHVVGEFSEEELAAMRMLMCKLQRVVQKNYLKFKKK